MEKFIYNYTVSTLIKKDSFIGEQSNKRHPLNKAVVFKGGHKRDAIDLAYTQIQLRKTLSLLTEVVANRSNLLVFFGNHKIQTKNLKKYFLQDKWIHGLVSNYKSLKKHNKTANKKLPGFVVSITDNEQEYSLLTKELTKLDIPYITIGNTSIESRQSPYFVPVNTNSTKTMSLVENLITRAITLGIMKETLTLKNTKLRLPRLDLNQRPVD